MSDDGDGRQSGDGGPPVVEPPGESEVGAPEGVVGAAVLAAGRSSRFEGGNKLLARVDGTPLVRLATESVLASAVDEVVVVLGHEAERVRRALTGLPVSFVLNEAHDAGQSTSVRAGVAVASARGWDAAIFALGDMPAVTPAAVDAVLGAYAAGRGRVLAAACDGQRGNPVLFDARYFGPLADVSGDVGGRELIRTSDDAALVETGDPGVLRDVDTESDLATVRDEP